MIGFNDRETPHSFLEIVENKSDSHAKALTLKVHSSVIGAFPLVRKPLETFLHLTEWSTMKIKDVIDNFLSKIMTEKVLLLKSSTHQNGVVASSPSRNGILSSWCVPSSSFEEVRYTSVYWEWIEDVLARNKDNLECNKTYDAIFVSLFMYDHNNNVLQAFYENWRPSTNTVSTFIGELSISLWDLRNIRGLHIHGSFYDEFILSAKKFTYVDDKGKPFLPRIWSHLFLAFYHLTKDVTDDVSFLDWNNFWFRGPRN
ncbi:hypothetical protein P3S67_025804 [Capsicum chacoense]